MVGPGECRGGQLAPSSEKGARSRSLTSPPHSDNPAPSLQGHDTSASARVRAGGGSTTVGSRSWIGDLALGLSPADPRRIYRSKTGTIGLASARTSSAPRASKVSIPLNVRGSTSPPRDSLASLSSRGSSPRRPTTTEGRRRSRSETGDPRDNWELDMRRLLRRAPD